MTPDRLRPANIARAAGAVASRAADVERCADRAATTRAGSPARGAALLDLDVALDETLRALRALVADAGEEILAHPLGVRAHAASEAVHTAGTLYSGALLARARAWRAGAADTDAATDQERRDAVAVAAAERTLSEDAGL